jgi:transposase-like protein
MAKRGRPNRLDDPDFAQAVADAYVSGATNKAMGAALDCDPGTIRIWVRDPRVRARVRSGLRERTERIARKIDGEIERRLADLSDMEIQDVLRVRKEYIDRPLKQLEDGGASEAGATNELAEAMDENPELIAELQELLDRSKPKALPAPQE